MINAGPVPFVAAALFAWTGGSWVLSLYLILAAALTFAAVSAAKETYKDDIEQIGR